MYFICFLFRFYCILNCKYPSQHSGILDQSIHQIHCLDLRYLHSVCAICITKQLYLHYQSGADNRTWTGTDINPMDFKSIVSAYSTISAYCGGGWIWTNIWDQQTSYLDDTPICMRIFTIAVSIRIFRLLHKCGVDIQCWNFNQPTERYLYRINRKNLITVFPVVSIKKEFIFFLNASFQFTKSVGGVPADLSLWSIWRCSPSCHSYYRSVFRPALRMGATQQLSLWDIAPTNHSLLFHLFLTRIIWLLFSKWSLFFMDLKANGGACRHRTHDPQIMSLSL